MSSSLVICSNCGKDFLKDNRHINENNKLGNNFYCFSLCQYSYKNKQIEFECENPSCNNKFKRAPNDISPHNFCSRSCAVTINNKKFRKRVAKIRKCGYCNIRLLSYRKYCSIECKSNALTLSQEKVIKRIR